MSEMTNWVKKLRVKKITIERKKVNKNRKNVDSNLLENWKTY